MNIPNNFYFLNTFETRQDIVSNPYAIYVCTNDMRCQIDESCFSGLDEKTRNIVANCIYMFLKRNPMNSYKETWLFIYGEGGELFLNRRQVNVWALVKEYPQTVGDKVTRILDNLSNEISVIGESLDIDFPSENPRAFLPESDSASISLIEKQLVEAGLFDEEKRTITFKGWERIESKKKNKESKKIFIASKFDGYKETIDSIKEAVRKAGFTPICMTDYQTNDYIMPEIFKQISESIAIVGEISSGNNGVYFELGFAKGLGIDTIVISKNEVEEKAVKAHFDIAQISIIYYNNLQELQERLVYRIKSTL